jgi:geranylgeranyl diphosphate synthase type II
MSFREYLAGQQQLIDRELDRLVPAESVPPETIHRAMRYSLFAGGKRVRPILCVAAGRAVADDPQGIETAACSLEFVHTYSLIHDDLPALDNDDYRRGKLTSHKVFGEAMAILTGDALLTLAFETLSKMDAPDDRKARVIAELATAAGTVGGMIGGQVADLENRPTQSFSNRFTAPRRARCSGPVCAWERFMRAPMNSSSMPSRGTASTLVSRFRLWTTYWTSSNRASR